MDQEGMLKPALIGGVLLGVLSTLPFISAFNCLCCIWVISGGLLAAHLYVKASPFPVTLGRGVLLGLITGAIGALVGTIFSIPLHLAFRGALAGGTEQLSQIFERLGNMPPELRDTVRSILAGGTQLSAAIIIMEAFVKLIIYGFFAMVGGAIGVALFEKRKPGAPGPGMPINIQPPTQWTAPPPPEPPDQA